MREGDGLVKGGHLRLVDVLEEAVLGAVQGALHHVDAELVRGLAAAARLHVLGVRVGGGQAGPAGLVQLQVVLEHGELDVGVEGEAVAGRVAVHVLEQVVAVQVAPQVHRLREDAQVDVLAREEVGVRVAGRRCGRCLEI